MRQISTYIASQHDLSIWEGKLIFERVLAGDYEGVGRGIYPYLHSGHTLLLDNAFFS